MGSWALGRFQDIENYDLQSPGTMFLRCLVAEKEPDVDDADEDHVALPGDSLRLRPNKPDLQNRLCYDRSRHHHVEVGESGRELLLWIFLSILSTDTDTGESGKKLLLYREFKNVP